MCGIAGVVGNEDTILVTKMLDALRHRGPDDIGIFTDKGITLGHTRLSIIDVERGRQPIIGDRGNSCIVLNGEIYNYKEIARRLRGHIFYTSSDSEAALHLFEEEGARTPAMLDGMFALAAYRDGTVLLARDPLGIKPLYYSLEDGVLYFASEMKALLYATDDVRVFPPGMYYVHGKGFRRFWSVPESHEREIIDASTAAKCVRELLHTAVNKRLMSDVPLGTFLSGGLDSTIVTALANSEAHEIRSFSTGMAESRDIRAARVVSEHLGTEHHELVFDEEDVIHHISRVVRHLESFDAALVRSAIPTYFVSQLARRYVKVVLMGEGADELFAGYRYLKGIPRARIHPELVRITSELHYLNLQRADRMTMAHALEGRVPFLDIKVVEYALGLPVFLKVRKPGQIEKWILRMAFDQIVPRFVTSRTKMKFAQGTGSALVVKDYAEREITDAEFSRETEKHPRVALRTKEELFLFRIFREFYPQDSVLSAIGRTQPCQL